MSHSYTYCKLKLIFNHNFTSNFSCCLSVLLASACLSCVLVMKLFVLLKLWNPVTISEYITGYSCLESFSSAMSVIVSDSGDIVLVDVRFSHIN